MIDPGDARSRRARELLISGIFLTISCIVVLLLIWWITDQQQEQSASGPLEAPVSSAFEPWEIVRVLTPDATDCTVFDTREAYDGASRASDRGPQTAAPTAAFKLPSGTRVRIVRVVSGGPVEVEVAEGPLRAKQGYVSRDFLSR